MKKVLVLGLGAGDIEQVPFGVYKKLMEQENLYLRTREHPVISELEEQGISFTSFDAIYEQNSEFAAVYDEICEQLLSKAETASVVYAVPGHPLVAERTVQLLLERGKDRGIEIEIGGGQSFLDAIFQALKIDPIEGFQLLDGTSLSTDMIRLDTHTIIGQVYDRFVASEVKLSLMEKLPDEYMVAIVTAAGSQAEEIKWIPLFELDRETEVHNLTSIYVPPVKEDHVLYREFGTLRKIIADLRGPNGCPWDKKQTHQSLKKYLIEEAYELIEAINNEDIDHMIEELGDVLLQVMLHAQIGDDDGYFTIEDVIEGISEKMVRRHPHVFGNVEAENVEEVLKNWEEIKQEEKGVTQKSLLDGVGKGLPNLLRATELQKEAAKVGFDWPDIEPVLAKVQEEISELQEAKQQGKLKDMELEFGDVLFALVNVARHYKIDPEEALFKTNQKFYRRFTHIEEKVAAGNRPFNEYSLEELDAFWVEAKEKGK
ncbi:tetrapyrrole methylase family protein / MazG family protein [Mesobacillus persicus]|uniref:Tetrapyrrole methylase family protein / MazG family protein n=1 Tax=Mesobacillus persicus TaxID=930146 RepID=A0A1H8JRY4_9BACI|nr:nucleoside triphosphate pyrophosphohydrolase [Mesobacillus persicus]SEN83117.1 tetrapyrrole methylase family protein / MazG family protein [Mesobacillus persicus]